MKVSVIVCCYNSARRIEPTLAHLEASALPEGVGCEVILVDNNCEDDTVALARRIWKRKDLELRIVEEGRAGLVYAREAGMRAAKGEVYLFVDDDNWLAPDYVYGVWKVLGDEAGVAIVGGRGIAVCDGGEPEWFADFARGYAIGSPTDPRGEVEAVVGAGMAVKAEVFNCLKEKGYTGILTGRRGEGLSSGEDLELCFAVQLCGFRCLYLPELTFKHYLPKTRLKEDYLMRMYIGFGESSPILDIYRSVVASDSKWEVYARVIEGFLRSVVRSIIPVRGGRLLRRVIIKRSRVIVLSWLKMGWVERARLVGKLMEMKAAK